MTRQALSILEKSSTIANEIINVGDMVLATPDGASFVSAYVYAIEDNAIIFMHVASGLLFDCERELAEQVTVLLAKFEETNRAQTINEILEMIA